jgi:hypothetical protein
MGLYDDLASTAFDLLTELGTTVTIRRFGAGALPDAAKPWRPGTPSEATFTVAAVADKRRNPFSGDMTEIVYLPALGLGIVPDTTDIVRLAGQDRGVTNVEAINPGGTGVIYILSLASPANLQIPSFIVVSGVNLDFSDAANSHHLVTIGL